MPPPFRSSEELFRACAESGTDADWREFIEYFGNDILKAVVRAARRWGKTNPELVQELVQDVYVKLSDRKRGILAGFQPERPGAEAAFLHVMATNLVNDYFKSAVAEIHGGGLTQISIEEEDGVVPDDNCGTALATEREILMREIDECLQVQGVPDRDRQIFWFYYRHGMKAREIAELTLMGLTTEGVESVIYRLTVLVREFVAGKLLISNSAAS